MSEIKFSNYKSEDGNTGPDLVGITTFTSPYYFVPPSGTTAQRPSGEGLTPGMLRFNTDIGRLEVWRNDHWATILGESPNLDGGARGITGGAYNDGATNVLNYITISTTGNAIDFGDALTATTQTGQGCASSTRGVWAGGLTPTRNNVIQYATISSTGNALDFGDLTAVTDKPAQCSNSTRGINVLGSAGPTNTSNIIDYITIASTGNAQDFGDVNYSLNYSEGASCASSTRGIFVIGYTTPANAVNVIEYATISTTGNAIDFGDLTISASGGTSCSNSTRGLVGAFYLHSNTIEFITIATRGNSQDFGDLIEKKFARASMSSSTRAVFSGGRIGSNALEYVTILSTGNAIDFGDLTQVLAYHAGLSNGHGGL